MGLFASILKSFMPGGRRRKKKRRGAVSAGGGFRPSEAGSDGKVMLAELFGSGGKEITERLAGMLSTESAVQTVFAGKALKKNLRVGLIERLLLAEEEGRNWLEEESADLLIWGDMEELGTVARLHFLALGSVQDGQPGTFGMTDTLDLPVPLPDDAGAIVRAATLAALLPVSRGARRTLAEQLVTHLGDAGKILDNLPKDMPQDCLIAIHNTLGNAYATSFRFGNKKALSDAMQHYEAADKLIDPQKIPITWAVINTHLGLVQEAAAKVDRSADTLMNAIKRYDGVAKTLSRDTHGNDWALAHMRRAMAYYKLAQLQPVQAQAHLKTSAGAFEEALTVYDRSKSPNRWAEVMNHYGVAQMALGGHGKAEAILQQSIVTFRKALEVRKRETQPVLWAQTANNLGAACFALAKQTKEEYLLEEAAYYFQGAVQIYRKARGQKKKAEVIAKNLMRVQQLLSEDAA
ncbi:tetratricopeptide repeat protein [Thalassospiraceae bacterium LMO-JJ14]|nr:tetratricopeptide repeat protein [Thalassospiraceae bacterium LMO-JJ14]